MKKTAYPTLLTIAASVGVVITAVSAAMATPKALDILKEEEREKRIDEIIAVAPVYIPTLLLGAATIAAVVGANCLSIKTQRSMASAYMLLDNSFKNYRKKVDELYGEEADLKVKEAISHDKHPVNIDDHGNPIKLFHESCFDVYFESTIADVIAAEYEFNRLFTLRGNNTMKEFYEFLGISDKYPSYATEDLGWDLEAGWSIYGYSWVDFEHTKMVKEDGTEYYEIEYPFMPTVEADNIIDCDWV